jgi:hypothetical protein
MVAVKGRQPIGYYKDEEKTDRTFRVIDGERYNDALEASRAYESNIGVIEMTKNMTQQTLRILA